MKKILLSLLALCSISAAAQHEFRYVAETDAVSFYMDTYTKKGKSKVDTVWEKRIFNHNAAGLAEKQRMEKLFPGANLKKLDSYYVKEVFDLKHNKTRMLAIYLFDSNMDEVASKKMEKYSSWQPILPETVTELQLKFVKAQRK